MGSAPRQPRFQNSWRVPVRFGPGGPNLTGGSVDGSVLAGAALTQLVAVTVHLEDVDMVGQAIEQRACEAL